MNDKQWIQRAWEFYRDFDYLSGKVTLEVVKDAFHLGSNKLPPEERSVHNQNTAKPADNQKMIRSVEADSSECGIDNNFSKREGKSKDSV